MTLARAKEIKLFLGVGSVRTFFLILALFLGLFIPGCGGDGDSTESAARAGYLLPGSSGAGGFNDNGGGSNMPFSPGTGVPVVFTPGVNDVSLAAIEVAPNPAAVAVGASVQLVTTGLTTGDSSPVPLPGQTSASVAYTVTDPAVATVSSGGLISGVNPGTTTVSVTVVNGGQTFTANVPVQVTASMAGQSIAYMLVSNPTPNGSGGSLTSIAVAADGTLSVIDNNTSVNRPLGMAMTPSGAFAYTANIFGFGPTAEDFSVFSVDAGSGLLSFLGTDDSVSASPQKLVVDPSGRFLYCMDFFGEIFGYQIGNDGRLTPNPDVTPIDLADPGITIPLFNAAGDRLYVAGYQNANIVVLDVAPATGALSVRNPGVLVAAGARTNALVFNPDESFLFVCDNLTNLVASFSVDANGDLSAAQTITASGTPLALGFHPTLPVLYVALQGTISPYQVDASGAMTIFGSPQPTGVNPTTLLLDPTNRFLYAVCRGTTPSPGSLISAYSVDPDDGSLTFVQDYPFPELSYASGAVMLPATP